MNFLSIFVALFVPSSLQNDRLFENDTCHSNIGAQGVCKRRDKCKMEFALNTVKICGHADGQLVICCPVEEIETVQLLNDRQNEPHRHSHLVVQLQNKNKSVSPADIARQKCSEYAKSVIVEMDSPALGSKIKKITVDLCARVEESLIVGGVEAKPREYPHMALIGYNEHTPDWQCGGSLISESFVLSAAHCSRPNGLGPALWAKLGEHDTSSEDDEAEPQVLRIIERIDHPDYNPETFYNDISLFKLERNIVFDPFIRPICLSTQDVIQSPSAIATGWGLTVGTKILNFDKKNYTKEVRDDSDPTSFDIRSQNNHHFDQERGPSNSILMKVKLNLISNLECNRKYMVSVGKEIPQGILRESMICAGDERGKDTCKGDSGGPLQIPIKSPYCMYDIIGLTSFGKQCGSTFPGVYTKISYFLPWIVRNVWPE